MPLINIDYQVITPAYGRDYKSAKLAQKDFLERKDFLLQSVTYGFDTLCSMRDFAPGIKVTIRYKNKTMATVVTVPHMI